LIREIVLFLTIKHANNPILTREEVISDIVNTQQCTAKEAEDVFSEMNSLGLGYCGKFKVGILYDLIEFALLRKYIEPNSEFLKKIHALWLLHHYLAAEIDSLEKKYQKEFGKKETWDEEAFSKYDDEKEAMRDKSDDAFAKIISEIVEDVDGLINKDRFWGYMQCLNVFFGQQRSMMESMIGDA
jgi:hypothetical protein